MNYCDKCNSCGPDPCGCGGCKPAKYGCDFNIMANPYDASIWNVTINGATTRVKIPKINETDTKLSTNYTSSSLIYNAEKHTDIITGAQLGALIKMEDLRDTESSNADSCDLMVFNPFCSDCGDGCKPKNARWTNYHIPDAGDCEMEPDDDGYYKVLTKNDCGCIEECRMPVSASGLTTIDYVRDSVPDDPDFPWYYGCYNDTINLHLAENASRYFGKYALKVTVNYGIQAIISSVCPNYNFRSLVAPVIEGQEVDVTKEASTLQGFAAWVAAGDRSFPWGTASLRSSFTFIVPKGKEAALHHEYRLRTGSSVPDYYSCPKDGQKVPDEEAQLDTILYPASRLHALQILVEPTMGNANFNPVVDEIRNQLDAPVDAYPNPVG
jgi:hypothetical protein